MTSFSARSVVASKEKVSLYKTPRTKSGGLLPTSKINVICTSINALEDIKTPNLRK